jgi:membrane-associated phospholipid phosphatase
MGLILGMLYYQGETNPYIYLAVIACQAINFLINVSIKNTLKAPRPDSDKDPKFPLLKPTYKNFFTVHRNYGMPSGHAQDVWCDFTFIALYFQNPFLTAFAAGQEALTIWHRYKNRRHTLKQLAVGSTIGAMVGLTFYTIFTSITGTGTGTGTSTSITSTNNIKFPVQ